MSHSVQGIELGALESKARRAFQAMQAEYRVNFDLRSFAIVIKSEAKDWVTIEGTDKRWL